MLFNFLEGFSLISFIVVIVEIACWSFVTFLFASFAGYLPFDGCGKCLAAIFTFAREEKGF